MAARGWGRLIAIAIGVAAGAGAAQIGLGYGLSVITWLPSNGEESEAAWIASLTWAAWVAMTSTIAGAACADRFNHVVFGGGNPSGPVTGLATALWRIVIAVAAAVGALITVALVAVPARTAMRADTFTPQTIAGGYAAVGVIFGLFVAIWALSSRAVATNILATVCWLWLLAIVAVIGGVAAGDGLNGAQLGVWQMTSDSQQFWFRDYFYWPGAALALGSALVIGALSARRAARQSTTRVGAAVSGGAGPLLVAAAYFLAAPKMAGIRAEQLSAHLMAPYAVLAGLAGSVLIAALAQHSESKVRPAPRGEIGHPVTAEEATPTVDQPADPPVEPAPLEPVTEADGPSGDPGEELAEDAYAPARAYVSDTASGAVSQTDSETGATTKSGEAVGRTRPPRQPLWPKITGEDSVSVSTAGEESKSKRRRPGRGKS